MNNKPELEKIENIIKKFVLNAKNELKTRWENWDIDLTQRHYHEVVGALLARQVTLARQIAECPPIWNNHIAPLVLRAMADVYITVKWIFDDPILRSKKFLEYGLGQAKLELEHRKKEIENREITEAEKIYINSLETWIDTQRFTFLIEVNVGSWSDKSTRKMAEESGCIDFYNYVYTPFSACTHSTWYHIGIHNLKQCMNPLHQFHRVPDDPYESLDPHNLYLAAKYLNKVFLVFDEKTKSKIIAPSAYDILCDDLSKFPNENNEDSS